MVARRLPKDTCRSWRALRNSKRALFGSCWQYSPAYFYWCEKTFIINREVSNIDCYIRFDGGPHLCCAVECPARRARQIQERLQRLRPQVLQSETGHGALGHDWYGLNRTHIGPFDWLTSKARWWARATCRARWTKSGASRSKTRKFLPN